MSMKEASKKSPHPQVITLNGALKLAENWVNGMSGSLEYSKSTEVGLESRPARLGIGATVPRESKVLNSNDPVERKLLAKLNAADKRKALKSTEEFVPSKQNAPIDEDSDDELESKTQAFTKKRPMNMGASLQTKKKCKRHATT